MFNCLASITVSQNVDPGKLFDSIIEAWNRGRSKCKRLKIACREKREDSAVFLFTLGSDVIAQFPIPTEVLKAKNVLGEYVAAIPVRAEQAQRNTALKITDLRPRMRGVSLRAKVVEISEPKTVYTGYGISGVVSNVLIADETGTTMMSLWEGQIDMVHEDALIEITNASVDSFRGELWLRLGKDGRIKLLE